MGQMNSTSISTPPLVYPGLEAHGPAHAWSEHGDWFKDERLRTLHSGVLPACFPQDPNNQALWFEGAVFFSGGTAFQFGAYPFNASGGQAQGGAAYQAGALPFNAAGGQAQGGYAYMAGALPFNAAGGQAQGGVAYQAGALPFNAAGGQAQGGYAYMAGALPFTAAGGQAQGGVAYQAGALPFTAAGGQAQGGAAVQGSLPQPAYRSSVGAAYESSSLTLYAPSDRQSGDILIACILSSGVNALTPDFDWNVLETGLWANDSRRYWIGWIDSDNLAIAYSDWEPNEVVNLAGIMVAVKGVNLVTNWSVAQGTSTTATASSVVSESSNSVLLSFFAENANLDIVDAPEGMALALRLQAVQSEQAHYQNAVGMGPTGDKSLSLIDSVDWFAALVCVEP